MVAEADDRPRVLVALAPRPLGAGGGGGFRVSRPHRGAFVAPLLRGSRRAPVAAARDLRAPARLVVLARLAPRLLVMGLRRSRRRAPLRMPPLRPGVAPPPRPAARASARGAPPRSRALRCAPSRVWRPPVEARSRRGRRSSDGSPPGG